MNAPRTAVVQGASGAIGAALVEALVARGGFEHIVATGRSLDRLNERLPDPAPGLARLTRIELDPGDDASITRGARAILDAAPRIDLLMQASGVLEDGRARAEKRLEHVSRESLVHAFEVNTVGPLLVTQALLPALAGTHSPRVAMLSARVGSVGDNGLGGWYGYRASKAALNMCVRTLAIELKRRSPGSLCVALHPGTVQSPLSAPFAGKRVVLQPSESAAHLLDVLGDIDPAETGSFWGWDGERIPW